jgi:hypothetical protein
MIIPQERKIPQLPSGMKTIVNKDLQEQKERYYVFFENIACHHA